MDFEDYGDIGDDDLFDDKNKPTEELNDDEVLNSVIKKTDPKDGKKKRTVTLKPRPKLTEHTLTGPKGLCALRQLFEKWNPHENKSPYDNLEEMMQKIEYWGHLLYPKSNFDDLLSKVEQLGKKRAVKVYMTKLRLGMPLFEEMDEKENEKLNDRRSESPVDKAFSPLPDDEDDFNDEAWDKLFDDPKEKTPATPSESPVKKKRRIEMNSDDEDDFEQPTSAPPKISQNKKRRAVMDSDDDDEVEQPASAAISKSQNRRVIIDSDDEDEVEEHTSPDKISQNKKRRAVMDSDDEDEVEQPASAAISKSQNRRVIIGSDDEDEDKAEQPSPDENVNPTSASDVISENKKRRTIMDSDDEDEVEENTSASAAISEETALDLIFGDD